MVPVGVTVNELLHVRLMSQNCFSARTVSSDPLGIVPTTSWRLMLSVVAPVLASEATVKICAWPPPHSDTSDPCGTGPGSALMAMDVCRAPVRSLRSVVMFGCPAAAMLGSSGGLSSLLTKPPFWLKPALKS